MLAPLPPDDLASVVEHCLPSPAAHILVHLPVESAAQVLEALSASSAIGILRQFDDSLRMEMLDRMRKTVAASLRRAMRYPPRTAGALADPRITTLPPDIPVHEAIERIRQDLRHATYYVYVIDRDTKLEGLVTLKELISVDRDTQIATLMRRQLVTISAEATAEEILQHPQWARFHTLPVMDRWGTFLGALRYRTLRALEREHMRQPGSGSLNHALIQLWEAYALAGIGILTDVALTLGARESTRTDRSSSED